MLPLVEIHATLSKMLILINIGGMCVEEAGYGLGWSVRGQSTLCLYTGCPQTDIEWCYKNPTSKSLGGEFVISLEQHP